MDRGLSAQAWVLGVALVLSVPAAAGAGSVIFVDDGAPPAGDGTSWATAYRFLQDALASPAAEIRVARGTYRPDHDAAHPLGSGDREATFELIGGLAINGGYAGLGAPDPDERDVDRYETVLSGDLNGDDGPGFVNARDNSYHVVSAIGAGEAGVLDGLTVTGGHADGPNYGPSPDSQDQGSAVNIYYASPRLVDCTFRGNWALNHGTVNDHGDAILIGCTFHGNYAGNLGAGLYVHHDAAVSATDCQFIDNTTPGDGGGAYNKGSVSAVFTNCTFAGNSASSGGGMYNASGSLSSLMGCSFLGNSASWGGGMYNRDSSPALTSCDFDDHSAFYGGAIYNYGASPVLTGCTFSDNSAFRGAGMYNTSLSHPWLTGCSFTANAAGQTGGGIYSASSSDLTLTDCVFTCNTANSGGGVYHLSNSQGNRTFSVIGSTFDQNEAAEDGGAIYSYRGNPKLVDCVLSGNSAGDFGGGVFSWNDGDALLVHCTLVSNTSGFGGGLYTNRSDVRVINSRLIGNTAETWGGAIYTAFGEPALVNCLFSGNTAVGNGGGIYIFRSSPTLTNCTLSGNAAGGNGGGIFNQIEGNPVLSNCILWENTDGGPTDETAQIFHFVDSQSVVNFSCIQSWTGDLGGVGNIGADPLFVDADGPDGIPGTEDDDLRLCAGSPCIDAGGNLVLSPCLVDLDTSVRLADDPATPDTGGGSRPIVDMGPYEFNGPPVEDCNANALEDACEVGGQITADCNGNGIPDECDLETGTSSDTDGNGVPDECQDCNGNGVFDPDDIADGVSDDCNGNGVPDECEPDCNGNGIVDACDLADGTSDDCNANGVPDECDVALLDCNQNGVVDACESSTTFTAESGELSPLGSGYPQSFTLHSPPPALSGVTLSFTAIGDLNLTSEHVDIYINGVVVGLVFNTAIDCSGMPITDQSFVSASIYNSAVAGGDAVIDMVPTSFVDPDQCDPASFISVSVQYSTLVDADGNGVPDECEAAADLDGDGVVNVLDLIILLLAFGECPAPPQACPADLNGDGVVDLLDLIVLLTSFG